MVNPPNDACPGCAQSWHHGRSAGGPGALRRKSSAVIIYNLCNPSACCPMPAAARNTGIRIPPMRQVRKICASPHAGDGAFPNNGRKGGEIANKAQPGNAQREGRWALGYSRRRFRCRVAREPWGRPTDRNPRRDLRLSSIGGSTPSQERVLRSQAAIRHSGSRATAVRRPGEGSYRSNGLRCPRTRSGRCTIAQRPPASRGTSALGDYREVGVCHGSSRACCIAFGASRTVSARWFDFPAPVPPEAEHRRGPCGGPVVIGPIAAGPTFPHRRGGRTGETTCRGVGHQR
jgi:hypothetical protein